MHVRERKEEDARWNEEEARKKEEEASQREEDIRKREDEIRRGEDAPKMPNTIRIARQTSGLMSNRKEGTVMLNKGPPTPRLFFRPSLRKEKPGRKRKCSEKREAELQRRETETMVQEEERLRQ